MDLFRDKKFVFVMITHTTWNFFKLLDDLSFNLKECYIIKHLKTLPKKNMMRQLNISQNNMKGVLFYWRTKLLRQLHYWQIKTTGNTNWMSEVDLPRLVCWVPHMYVKINYEKYIRVFLYLMVKNIAIWTVFILYIVYVHTTQIK